MAARRPSWIRHTQFFVCRWAPWGYMLIPNLVTLAYTVMKTSLENWKPSSDDRRRTTLECNSPTSGLKMSEVLDMLIFDMILSRTHLHTKLGDHGSQAHLAFIFPFFDNSRTPGGQMQKSIFLKFCTLIDFSEVLLKPTEKLNHTSLLVYEKFLLEVPSRPMAQ